MTELPPDVVEAASRALFDLAGGDPERWPEAYLKAGWRGMGEAAVAAVLPLLRAQIADEIEAEAKPYGDPAGYTDKAILSALRLAAGVARGVYR